MFDLSVCDFPNKKTQVSKYVVETGFFYFSTEYFSSDKIAKI